MSENSQRVLIVDDDPGIRRSLARIMRGKGYHVETARDGDSAVALAQTFRPKLLLIDVCMPGIDGVEAFERIRADNPHILAIFMTAYSSSLRTSEALASGAISVLSKPLDLESLSEMVRELLHKVPLLIVDDDAGMLPALETRLESKGIDFVITRSTSEAMESLRHQPQQMVLIVGSPHTDREVDGEFAARVHRITKTSDLDKVVLQIDQISKGAH